MMKPHKGCPRFAGTDFFTDARSSKFEFHLRKSCIIVPVTLGKPPEKNILQSQNAFREQIFVEIAVNSSEKGWRFVK